MGGQSLVEVSNLHRRFGDVHAVQGLSFALARGEVLGLLGLNGAGKTTTMQMLSGVLAPSEGEVRIGGVDLLDRPIEAKRQLGYLPERPPLYRELTVREYLRYGARLRGLRGRAGETAVEEAMARCALADSAERLIANLSKGYQQRVGIAQAIVHRPLVVILDEPTVGLDPVQIREIRALIAELGEDHGVILSTHILPEVQAVCDRALIINAGRLVLDEPIEAGGTRDAAPRTRIALRRPPPRGELERLPGVARVQEIAPGVLRVFHTRDADPVEQLTRAAVEGSWGLYELAPELRSLEEIFISATCGEAAPATDGAKPVPA